LKPSVAGCRLRPSKRFWNQPSQAHKVHPTRRALQTHHCRPPFVDLALYSTELFQTITNAGLRRAEIGLATGSSLRQFVKKFELMTQFGFDPTADQFQPFRLLGCFDLPSANGRRAAHALLPEAAERIARPIQKDDVDVMFGGQLQNVAR
jgi:hypothetical protein